MRYEELCTAFEELRGGLTPQEAVTEAARCIHCEDAPCARGCPAGVDVSKFIRQIASRNFRGAIKVIREDNILAGVCARICPQSRLCEGRCSSSELAEPIRIGRLQRFAADEEMRQGPRALRSLPPKGIQVVVAGSGPAGLAASAFLRRLGYDVDLFEEEPHPGGVLTYGIPAYRLPKHAVLEEVEYIRKLGVAIHLGRPVEEPRTLLQSHRAVFLATGCRRPLLPGVTGEDLPGVLQALDVLREVNLALLEKRDCRLDLGQRVVVVGGGNAAMDAAVTARKLGAASVTVLYRRSEEEMPAWEEERAFALAQGVEFRTLASPLGFEDSSGRLGAVQCQVMQLGDPDASGRRRPLPRESETFTLPCSAAILALGQAPGPVPAGLRQSPEGFVAVDPETLATSVAGLFAGGDLIRGSDTAVSAVADGRRAAFAMDEWIQQDGVRRRASGMRLNSEFEMRNAKWQWAERRGHREERGKAKQICRN